MTAQARIELMDFSGLERLAATATMDNYGDLLQTIAAYTTTGSLDAIQREGIIIALTSNTQITAGKVLIKNALAKVEAALKRASGSDMGGIKGGRGVYALKVDGVYFSKPTKEGYAAPVRIAPHLQVIAETYDTADGNNGRYLEFKDTRGRLKTWAMPAIFAAGDGTEIAKYLRQAGLNYVYGYDKELIDYLLSSPVTDLMTCSDRTGWVDDVFITPKRVYGENAESYIYQPVGTIDNKIGQAGTLADWQANVSRYAQNNPLLMTAVSFAFAGALLNKVDMMGFGLHIFGGSSIGKTTALQMAGSVWGKEFWQQWLATSVGLEGSAHAHNDGLLCLDEIGEATAQTVSATAYALANGEGKRRGGRDGNAKITKKWREVFLSTGEYSLDHMMKAAGIVTRAGQEVRMINMNGGAWAYGCFNDLHGLANGSEFSEMLKANTAKVYGTAGDAWLEAITAPGGIPKDISQAVDVIRESFLPEGASGQVRRVARQFALTAYAGELATKHGITGWKEGEATAAAKECFPLWMDGFGGADGSRETRQIIEAVQSFLTRHFSKFQDMALASPIPVHDRVGYHRMTATEREYIVPSTELHRLAEGHSKDQIITALRTVGMINEPTKNGKDSTGKDKYTQTVKVRTPEGNRGCFVIQPTPTARDGLNVAHAEYDDVDVSQAPF